jgi:hypothetical protein
LQRRKDKLGAEKKVKIEALEKQKKQMLVELEEAKKQKL